jgi:hypothetical protein
MFSAERLSGIFTIIVGVVGVAAAIQLPLTEEFSFGAGMTPLVYGVGLLIFSLIVIAQSKDAHPIDIMQLTELPARNGALLLLLMVMLAVVMDFVGFTLSIFAFTFSVLIMIVRQQALQALLFAVCWSMFLKLVFEFLLEVRLPVGAFINL